MTENRNPIVAVAILITLVGVVLSCCVGAIGGMMAASIQFDRMADRLERLSVRSTPFLPGELPPPAPEDTPESQGQPSATSVVPRGFEDTQYPGGAVVLQVRLDGPALASGLRRGDVIVAVGDTAITPAESLTDALRDHEPGDRVTIRYWRDGDERTASVELDASPADPQIAYLGVTYSAVPSRATPESPSD